MATTANQSATRRQGTPPRRPHVDSTTWLLPADAHEDEDGEP